MHTSLYILDNYMLTNDAVGPGGIPNLGGGGRRPPPMGGIIPCIGGGCILIIGGGTPPGTIIDGMKPSQRQ